MALVTEFVDQISKSSKDDSSLSLFILNSLKTMGIKKTAPLTPNLLQKIYFKACTIDYWEKKKLELVTFILVNLEIMGQEIPLDFDLESLSGLFDVQTLKVDRALDLLSIVSRELKRNKSSVQKIKLKILRKDRVLAIILNDNKSLFAKVYSSHVRIEKGQLVPLPPVSVLRYNGFMELQFDVVQILETDLFTSCFSLNHRGVRGVNLSGPYLQTREKFTGLLDYNCPIFYNLKSLERHYIDLGSDPFYKEICRNLKKSINLLKVGSIGAPSFAQKALKAGNLATKYVFRDDKYIDSLLIELEKTINSEIECLNQKTHPKN